MFMVSRILPSQCLDVAFDGVKFAVVSFSSWNFPFSEEKEISPPVAEGLLTTYC